MDCFQEFKEFSVKLSDHYPEPSGKGVDGRWRERQTDRVREREKGRGWKGNLNNKSF